MSSSFEIIVIFDPAKPDESRVYSSLLGLIRISGVSALILVIKVENIIIESLSRIGLKAEISNEHHGIFIEKKNELYKIASIGMKFKKWISFHGFSLNIDPDLENYKGIRPCGLNNNLVTSVKNEGITIEKEIIDDILIDEIKNHFLK